MNNIFTYVGMIVTIVGLVGLLVGDKKIALIFVMIGILIMTIQTLSEFF